MDVIVNVCNVYQWYPRTAASRLVASIDLPGRFGPACFGAGDDPERILDPLEIFPRDQVHGRARGVRAISKQFGNVNLELARNRGEDVDADIDLAALDLGDVLFRVADPFGKGLLTPATQAPQSLHASGHTQSHRQVDSHRGGNYRPTTAGKPQHIGSVSEQKVNLYVLAARRTITVKDGCTMSTACPADSTSTTTSSRRLLDRARVGDRAALGRLIGRCLPALTRWAHRRLPQWARTAADTTDLVQDAVLRTLRQTRTLDVRSRHALAAYLREAVQNHIRDEHRRIARRGVQETLADSLLDREPSPLDRVLTREQDARYRAALARLSPRDRELIVAHVELDYTHAQLGCMTGRSANAARMALDRAVRRLAARMRDG
jgi:RNA polymerase sigma factor (sigma-70 family)